MGKKQVLCKKQTGDLRKLLRMHYEIQLFRKTLQVRLVQLPF